MGNKKTRGNRGRGSEIMITDPTLKRGLKYIKKNKLPYHIKPTSGAIKRKIDWESYYRKKEMKDSIKREEKEKKERET